MGDALDLGARVAHRVEGFVGTREMPVDGRAAAARLAEVDVAGQLADQQDVQASHQFGLQRRRVRQLLVADGRAEVRKQAQRLAQAEDRLLGAQRALELVVLPVAHGAEQHRVGFLGQLEGGLGQGMAVLVVSHAAHVGELQLELQVQDLQDLDGLFDDLGAYAVARQDCDFHGASLIWMTNDFAALNDK